MDLKEEDLIYQNLSKLQKFVRSPYFDAFILSIIGLNCILLAIDVPGQDTPASIVVLNVIFNAIYLFEIGARIFAFGVTQYFSDRMHIIDLIVSIVSFIEILFLIIKAIADAVGGSNPVGNVNVLEIITILRVLRALRPLKGLSFLPFVRNYMDAVTASIQYVFLNAILLGVTVCGLGLLFFALINDRLQYRCVPTDFTSANVLNNVYYSEFGSSFFNSTYNSEVCGWTECGDGFSCIKVAEQFAAIQGDFETPWNSIITSLSFLTLRGWPNIYWAIADAKGPYIALLALMLIPSITFLLVLNLFPAVFIVAMKRGEERVVKRELLKLYPGDVNQVTELELLAWANRNRREIIVRKRKDNKKKTDEMIKLLPWLEAVDENGNSVRKKKLALEAKMLLALPSADGKTPTIPTAVPVQEEFYDSDEDEPKPEEFDYDTTIMVPNCYGCETLRGVFADDSSRYSFTIMAIVMFNIFMLSLDSDDPSPNITAAIFYSNIAFNSIYGLDVVLKIMVLGPVRYFCSPMNDLDFTLTLIGLLGVGGFDLPRYLNNFRILRLLRLLRFYRLKSLGRSEYSKKNRDPSITIEKLAFMMSDIMLPLLNVSVILMLFMYMWSILGMTLFAEYSYADISQNAIVTFNITAIDASQDMKGNLLNEADLQYQWWGASLTRMSFDNFPTAFVTLFNLLAYNSWYEVMVNTLRISGSNNSPWFFITWLTISNFFVISTLTASIAAFMERFAQDNVSSNAKAAKYLVLRMKKIREKAIKRAYFSTLKKHTIDDNEYNPNNVTGERGGRSKTIQVVEAEEIKPLDPMMVRTLKERKNYSFYLFSPENYFRRGIKYMINTLLFQSIVAAAIIISVVSIITDDSTEVLSESQWKLVDYLTPFVFFIEMALQWIGNCMYGTPGCYFSSPVNFLDFAVNIVLAVNYGVSRDFSNVRIARLAKLPQVLILVSRSESLTLILQSYRDAYKSLFLVTTMLLGFIAFFGVVGLQIWLGQFTHCSYDEYPAGRNRFLQDSEYPYGCNGTAYVPIYGLSTSELIYMTWNTKLDNFDDIFKSCKSVFKIMLFNNWANILYDSLDITGSNTQPLANNSRTGFLFFMVVIVFAFMIGVLYMAVIYYHFVITRMTKNSGLIVGENAALWSAFQQRLGFVEKQKFHHASTHITGLKKKLNILFKQSNLYRLLIVIYTLVPVVIISAYRTTTYRHQYFVFIEFGMAIAYVTEYMLRMYADDFQFYQTLAAKLELSVVMFELLQIATCVADFAYVPFRGTALLIIHVGIFVRVYRLFVAFPHFHILIRSILRSINSFVPCLLNLIFVILIYGKIAVLSFEAHNFKFSNEFLEDHYHFHDVYHACITMVAMATGNMWTEVVFELKSNESIGWKFWVEFFFTSYYLIIYFLLKTFAIIVISKYSIYAGGSIGLANQQLRQFRMAWLKLKNPNTIDFNGLLKLLQILKAPLGCGKQTEFLSVVRFAKAVLVSMPENDKNGAAPMFDVNKLPDDIRMMMKEKNLKFTFHMVLTALHKKCMLGAYLPDEAYYYARRELHKERLGLLKLRIGRLTSNKYIMRERGRSKFDDHVSACRNQLVLQRLDPKRYHSLYLHIMSDHLATVRKNIQSYGYGGFDTFFISILSKAARNQHRAALSQLKLKKTLNPQFLQNPTAIQQYDVAKAYELNVRYILEAAKDLSEKYVGKLWSVDDMVQLAKFQEKGTVSAIAVDTYNTIFAGFSTGMLKIWKNTGGQGEISLESKYRVVQTIELEGWIRSMTVSPDGLVLFVGVGSETVMLSTKGGMRRKVNFTEVRRFKEHTGNVNGLVLYGRYLCTASDDGYVYIYALATGQPVNSYYVGASIYCMSQVAVIDENDPSDDAHMTDILACGAANGYLTVLPLPLLSGASNDSQSLEAISVYGGNCAISSIKSCWKFIYTGYVDGSIKIWAMAMNPQLGSPRYPIRMISLIRVSSIGIHSGPVTSMAATGGHFFSASHDFSILPWKEPEKLEAKSEAEFTQSQATGIVVHNHAIVCMAANKNMIVSGDDCGQVVVIAPKSYTDQFSNSLDTFSNQVSFSFLEYDFKSCFLPTNGCVSEEEAYLNIKNVSEVITTVRCLSPKVDGFHVEMNPIVNMKRGVNVKRSTSQSGQVLELLEFGPNHAAQYRIIFSPEDDRGYNQLIEFLVDEKYVIRVMARGVGVKNEVIVESGKTHIEFESITVGQVGTQSIRLINVSPKMVAVSLYDEPQQNNPNEEKINLNKQNIQIIPKSFVIKGNESVDIIIRYNPEIPMTSFELPLKFAISGAVCTMATIRARAQLPHDNQPIDKKSSLSFKYPKNNPELNAVGLRALDYSETLCPGELTNLLLNANGYRIFVDKHVATLLHVNTGVFLEFVNPNTIEKHWLYSPHVDSIRLTFRCQHEQRFHETSESTVDALKGMIGQMTMTTGSKGPLLSDFINIEPTATKVTNLTEFEDQRNNFYEIWHGDRLVSYGTAETGKTVEVVVKASDLYIYTDNVKIESCGFQVLELLVFSLGERFRQSSSRYTPKAVAPDYTSNGTKYGSLRSVTYVKIAQGFRMIRSKESADMFTPMQKLEVIGIEEVVTFLPGGLGSISEVFGQGEQSHETGSAEVGSPVFAPVKIFLRSTDSATQYKVTDHVSSLEREDSNKVIKQIASVRADSFKSTTGLENIDLVRPRTKGMNIDENNCARRIDIELSRKEVITDTGATQVKVLRKCSVYTHTVQQILTRAKALSVDATSLLPHEIRSYPLSVSCDVIQPKGEALTRMVSFNLITDLLLQGRETRSKQLTNLFNGQWFFVVDRSRLKIVNADPDVAEYSDVYQLSAVDITFTPHGCFMLKEDSSGMIIEGGQVIRSNNVESLPKIKKEVLRVRNFLGNPSEPRLSPAFLSNIWIIMQKDNLLNQFRRGMMGLLIKRQQRLRYEAEIQVAAMKKALDDKERDAMLLRKNKQLTSKELEERRQVENKKSAILDAVTEMKRTYKEVFEEMVRLTQEFYKSNQNSINIFSANNTNNIKVSSDFTSVRNRKLHILVFSQYLLATPLPGSNKPYTSYQVEILLRDLLMDDEYYVPVDFFKDWYHMNDGKKLASQLNEKNIFALLLDYELKRLEGENETSGSSELKRIEKPGDSVILKNHLNTSWEYRDDRHERHHIENLIKNAFTFSYKGGLIRKGITQTINHADGVEFRFSDPNDASAAAMVDKTSVIPAKEKKSWLRNMFRSKDAAKEAADRQVGIELLQTQENDGLLNSESKDERENNGVIEYKSVGSEDEDDADNHSSDYNESILGDDEDQVVVPIAADYDSEDDYDEEVEEES